MGQHWSHLTPTKRIQLDAFIRAGMKPTDIAKELGVHHTTIYRELKRCTYEHLNSDYTTETRYNPEGAQARYEANLRAKGPELKIGNDYELADDNRRMAGFLREAHGVCDTYGDVASTSLIEVWIDESERRAWFLYEASHRS